MMFETVAIEAWTGRFFVWMYWIHAEDHADQADDKAGHAERRNRSSAPPMKETVLRSGSLMSDSLARRDGMKDAASMAAAPYCHALCFFMVS